MTCAEFKELVAAFALGALEPDERAAMEAHLASPISHEGCAQALAQAHEAAAALGRALPPVRPEERVWRQIAASAGLHVSSAAPRPRRLPAWTPWAVAAVASVAAVVLGVDRARVGAERTANANELIALQTQLGASTAEVGQAKAAIAQERARCEQAITQLRNDRLLERQVAALMEQPGTQIVPLGPASSRRLGASAVVNTAQHRAYVLATTLPVSEGHDYELWVIRGKDAPLPAGLMRDLGNGMMLGEIDAKLLERHPDALALSLEPAGGRPTPTEVVAVGKLNG